MSEKLTPTIVIEADYINPIDDKSTELVRDGAIVLRYSKNGYCIADKGPRQQILDGLSLGERRDAKIIERRDYVLAPAFIDLHFHWVQDDVRLMPKDSLLEWLSEYTWPYEAKFSDTSYSRERAAQFAQELLRVGTLGGLVYGSIHDHTVDHALEFFQGHFVVGNVLMTMNSPENLTQTPEEACSLIERQAQRHLHHYAMTPRFAPTTHPEVMSYAAELAVKFRCFTQTHLSENLDEINYVLDIFRGLSGFEDVASYTEIYDRCGLLGEHTVLGHAIHLSDEEWQLLGKSKTAIAHCPSSNAPVADGGLGSGTFDYTKADHYNVRWALGSDIGGGPYLSMIDVMASFVRHQKRSHRPVSFAKAYYRATKAPAEIMKISDQLGTLNQGTRHFILLPKLAKAVEAEDYLSQLCSLTQADRSRSDEVVVESYCDGVCLFSQL